MNVECATVYDGSAEFAGVVTSVTGDDYNVGEVRLWKVIDGGTPGTDGDIIGGTGPQSSLGSACDQVESGSSFSPQGIITGGNLVVHFDAD